MPKTSIDPGTGGLVRHALNGPTMGTRWTALVHLPAGTDPAPLRADLQAAVDSVDCEMSLWQPDSALMRLNRAPLGRWVALPTALLQVLDLGLAVGHASGGAFDMAVGDAVAGWGFGPGPADPERIRAARSGPRCPAGEGLEVAAAAGRARRRAPVTLDLNGIAKGFGVDRLAATLVRHGLGAGLVGIDGEMRALGTRPDGNGWTLAIEAPDPRRRAPLAILALQDAAVATSGDYRHWVEVGGRRLSHTMDPARGVPLADPPASVTVVARTCAEADAWATALMVAGSSAGPVLARQHGLDALFLIRGGPGGLSRVPVGRLFGAGHGPQTGSRSPVR
jgi:thiamine biosynthesis lipoprotein